MKRSPLKRGKPLRRRASLTASVPLKPGKRLKSTRSGRARPADRLAVWCEAQTSACTGRAVHRHHKRGRVGADADSREHTIDVCDSCHRHIHDHPTLSYERGWMERRTGQ